VSEAKLYELVEALDQNRNPVEGGLPAECAFRGMLGETIVITVGNENEMSIVGKLEAMREFTEYKGVFLVVPPEVRFLKLREVE